MDEVHLTGIPLKLVRWTKSILQAYPKSEQDRLRPSYRVHKKRATAIKKSVILKRATLGRVEKISFVHYERRNDKFNHSEWRDRYFVLFREWHDKG